MSWYKKSYFIDNAKAYIIDGDNNIIEAGYAHITFIIEHYDLTTGIIERFSEEFGEEIDWERDDDVITEYVKDFMLDEHIYNVVVDTKNKQVYVRPNLGTKPSPSQMHALSDWAIENGLNENIIVDVVCAKNMNWYKIYKYSQNNYSQYSVNTIANPYGFSVDNVINRISNGETIDEISSDIRVSVATLKKAIREKVGDKKFIKLLILSKMTEVSGFCPNDANIHGLKQRFYDGETLGNMAHEFGISSATLAYYLVQLMGKSEYEKCINRSRSKKWKISRQLIMPVIKKIKNGVYSGGWTYDNVKRELSSFAEDIGVNIYIVMDFFRGSFDSHEYTEFMERARFNSNKNKVGEQINFLRNNIDVVVKSINGGKTFDDVARRMKISDFYYLLETVVGLERAKKLEEISDKNDRKRREKNRRADDSESVLIGKKDEIVKLFKDGNTISKISTIFSCNPKIISKILKDVLGKKEYDKILENNLRTIKREFNNDYYAGIKMKRAKDLEKLRSEHYDTARRMYLDLGMKAEDIADILKLDIQAVCAFLDEIDTNNANRQDIIPQR